MDIGGEGVSVYAEAKSEYTKQLCQYLVPPIQQYFLDLLDEATQKESDSKRVLLMFQTLLEDISNWNMDKVQRETGLIVQKSSCDYLEELMTAVFIAHTKVLSAIRLTTKQKKLQIAIPKLDHFLHRTMTECARLLWSNTYLFSTSSPSMERQKNLRQIETFLHEGVLQGIRGMLPVKSILREYLKEDDDEDEEVEETEEEVKKVEEDVQPTQTEIVSPPPAAAAVAAVAAVAAAPPAVVVAATPPVPPAAPTVVAATSQITGSDTKDANNDIVDIFEDDGRDIEEVKILEDIPPEPLEDFVDLDTNQNMMPMDFEELA
jgi:hypothetical protein